MIILGLGSNLNSSFGNRFENLEIAIEKLKKEKIKILKKSSFYESNAYPNVNDPKFINIIIKVEVNLEPSILASKIISIEENLERKRYKKNDPRTCDIDIIDFDGKAFNFKYKNLDFTVPHTKLIYRNFVLYPLKEIEPYWRHPLNNHLVDYFIDNLDVKEKNSILKVKKS
jgi:2-amino-4-hydroxy-6-hydroxymethyldihydropteridine diphosphokinase